MEQHQTHGSRVEKCESSLFSTDSGESHWSPVINGVAIPTNPTPRFLGIKLDRLLTFAFHTEAVVAKKAAATPNVARTHPQKLGLEV